MRKRILDQRWPWLLASFVVTMMFVAAFAEIDLAGDSDPRQVGTIDDIPALRERDDLNVLFILIDTLRADRLGSYGYERDTTPELDRLAAGGIRFAHQLAQASWTKASMASMWTGLYPRRIGVTRYDHVITDQATLPAEILKEAGYQTVAIYRNGWVSPNFGFDQGFDVYTRPAPNRPSPSIRRENPTLAQLGTDEDAIKTAEEFIRVRGHERWFLYLHLMDVHEYLYDEDTALFGGSYSDVYDNSIRWVDRAVGHLLRFIEAQGYAENTIVAVLADHGEAFRERGFEGHARVVYRESTEVPFLVQLPFRLDPGVVVRGRTRNVDVWPTLLDLIGLHTPGPKDGRSRVADIIASARGESVPETDGVGIAHLDQRWGQQSMTPMPTVAVTEGTLRYVRTLHPGGGPVLEELFDAQHDRLEQAEVGAAHAESLARLRALADEYLETPPEWGEAPTRELDELELNQLRALGYALP
jgi:arylsulfatase A-like enzyme